MMQELPDLKAKHPTAEPTNDPIRAGTAASGDSTLATPKPANMHTVANNDCPSPCAISTSFILPDATI